MMNETSGRIRVAVVIGQMSGGGAEKQVALLAEHIDRRAFDLKVITFVEGGRWATYLNERGIRVVVIKRRGHYDITRHLGLVRYFRSFRPQVVLAEMLDAHVYATPAAVLVGVHGIAVGYRTVGFDWRWVHRVSEKLLLPFVDVQLANARAVSRDLSKFLRTTEGRHWIVYNALDPESVSGPPRQEARRALGLGEEAFLAGFVASFSVEKEHETALRALSIASRTCPRLMLIMVGEGPQMPRMKTLADDLGVSNQCRFLGYREDIGRFLRAFDITLNCSTREGCCNAIIESLAAGVPVLASSVGGNIELVGNDDRGRLFPAGGVRELATLLAAAYREELDLMSCQEAGPAFVKDTCDLHRRVRDMERLFRVLANRPRRMPLAPRGPIIRQNEG